ncbi:MAG: hypothetical protein RL417_1686 [Pseudomonadota bacterium]
MPLELDGIEAPRGSRGDRVTCSGKVGSILAREGTPDDRLSWGVSVSVGMKGEYGSPSLARVVE